MSVYFCFIWGGISKETIKTFFFQNKENAQVKIENYFEI